MTPVESRKSENPNRVRCFNKSTLIEGICDEKWDLVKVNRSTSFISNNIYYFQLFIIDCLHAAFC